MIETGVNGMGLRYAQRGPWRLTILADGNETSWRMHTNGSYLITNLMPADVRAELLSALREPRRYDVRASCLEIATGKSDGAYSLILDGATAEEIADRLREVLQDGFGLSNAGPCRLSLNIGPAGTGDDLPL